MKSLRSRANSLGMIASPTQTSTSAQSSPASQSSAISNVSGGVNVDANNVAIGNDVVGCDKIV
jgi:hypothetical protein